MSLQLPAILSPPTLCTPLSHAHCLPQQEVAEVALPFTGRRPVLGFALPYAGSPMHLAVSCSTLFCIMDWQFISGCLPPRLSTTQFPSTTDSQCSVRWGLPPHYWCALSGARRVTLLRDRYGLMIGVGTTDEVAPPSEPSRPISGTRLSSWWLISKGDQPTHPDSFRVRAMDGSCCQGGRQTPSTSGRFAYSRCASPI